MAQIQIWTRDVNSTSSLGNYAPQHTFLIKVNDDGTREIIRGGPDNDSMITGDIGIVKQSYNDIVQDDKITTTYDYFDPSLPNTSNYQGSTIKTSSQLEIDSLWNKAWTKAQEINNQKYDYEALTQNCNTVTHAMAEEMGLVSQVKSFLDSKDVFTPGFDDDFNHSLPDKIYDLITNPSEEFNKILDFIKNNPALEFELGKVSDSYNLITDSLNSLLNDAKTINTYISNLLTSLSQAESTRPVVRYDPLTLDLDGDGIELIPLNQSTTFFDLQNDGLKRQVGWVKADDGILVYDQNNNKSVDNISELFGYTDKNGNRVTGTEELKTHDIGRSITETKTITKDVITTITKDVITIINQTDEFGNIILDENNNPITQEITTQETSEIEVTSTIGANDNIINKDDPIFTKLQIWQDLNQDGISQAEELKSLSDYNITAINLNNIIPSNQNVGGNVIISTGTYQIGGDVIPFPIYNITY